VGLADFAHNAQRLTGPLSQRRHRIGITDLARKRDTRTMPKHDPRNGIPETFLSFVDRHPALCDAHEAIARAVDAAGPLDRKTCELIKIGLSVGAGLETATRSHVRRALEHGASAAEIEQTILLAMNTCGFPRTVAAWKWAQTCFARGADA
jgi:alkylhydroperoxidase/carboxymuconolactone decarboxylase family protein YurZ